MSVRVQGPRYVSTAVLAALSDWVAFVALGWLGSGAVAAQAVSRLVGGATAFGLHRVWTYEADGAVGGQVGRFLLLYALSYGLSLGLLHLLVPVGGLPAAPSKLAADTACFAFNFLAMKTWVFAPPGDARPLTGRTDP